jgi:hypothetical protein
MLYGKLLMGLTSDYGANVTLELAEEEIALSTGGATTDSVADLLPANSIILSVSARITTAVAGVDSTGISVGDPTTAARFGSLAALTAGTTVVGIDQLKGAVASDAAGPTQSTAAKVRLTCAGGADNTPTAGKVRVAVSFIRFTAPTA